MNIKKIKNLALLLLCYIKYSFSSKANKENNNPKKVLIIQTAKLGDMVCITPMFRAVKEKYPKCEVYVMGDVTNMMLLTDHPDVDGYIVQDFNHLFRMIKKVRTLNFDFATTVFPNFDAVAIMYLAGIKSICVPRIVGYSPYFTRAYRMIIKFVATVPHFVKRYAAWQYLKTLELINIFTENTQKHLAYSGTAPKFNQFTICITPTAGNKIKEWPPEKFVQLIEHIHKKYEVEVILTVNANEEGIVMDVLDQVDTTCVTYVPTTINQLKALISQADLFIGVDTGPIYIAEAFGVPTIDILGPVSEHDQAPKGKYNKNVVADRKESAIYIMNSRRYDVQEAKRQVNDITVEMVIKVLDELMQLVYPKNMVSNSSQSLPLAL